MSVDYEDLSESVLFCEGYHDRAFLAGWLKRLGWVDPGEGNGRRIAFKDPFGGIVAGGQYGLVREGRFVRIQPCRSEVGKGPVEEALDRLRSGATKRVRHAVIVTDGDVDAPGDGVARRRDIVNGALARRGVIATALDSGAWSIDDTSLHLVVWHARDAASKRLPSKQMLERLVVAALDEVDSARTGAVAEWLCAEPSAPDDDPKRCLASVIAKWHQAGAYEAFLRTIWSDGAIAPVLERRLEEIGALEVVASL